MHWLPTITALLARKGVGADNLCHLGRCSAVRGLASSAGEPILAARARNGLRLAGLKLVFLTISSAMSLLRLPHRGSGGGR